MSVPDKSGWYVIRVYDTGFDTISGPYEKSEEAIVAMVTTLKPQEGKLQIIGITIREPINQERRQLLLPFM